MKLKFNFCGIIFHEDRKYVEIFFDNYEIPSLGRQEYSVTMKAEKYMKYTLEQLKEESFNNVVIYKEELLKNETEGNFFEDL